MVNGENDLNKLETYNLMNDMFNNSDVQGTVKRQYFRST